MKVLLIGGTGVISSAITRALARDGSCELFVLNRGNHNDTLPQNVTVIKADIGDEQDVADKLQGMFFDCVCEFIGFLPEQVERDWRLLHGRTLQYIYISSASAYNKPVQSHIITEGTALANPYWQYSRDKIACEQVLMKHYREDGFPVTIVRPSHTYNETKIPVAIHGLKGSWQVVRRMMEGKRVLVHGDGQTLWTLTWNEDFARGFVGLIANSHAIGEAFNITGDESLTWNQIYKTIADALGVEYKPYYVASSYLDELAPAEYDLRGNLLGDKAASVVFDCSKLKRAVPDFHTEVRFAQGCRRALDYTLSHPSLQVEDPMFDKWCDRVIETLEETRRRWKER